MTDSRAQHWEPATAEDLVADALSLAVPKATPRLITDWTERGLLGSPTFQKTTRHGSDARLYSPQQRRLFHELLKIRQRSPLARVPIQTLIRPVLHVWLTDDTVIPDTQARRAWRTWARSSGKGNAAWRSDAARAVVDQLAHPDTPYHQRRKAQLVIEEAEKTRTPDWGKIHSVLTAVCSPWPGPHGPLIERALGTPQFPFGVQETVAMAMLSWRVTLLLATEGVCEAKLAAARGEFRQDWAAYESLRTGFQQQAPGSALFTKPEDLEQQIKEQLRAFVSHLGFTLGLAQGVFAEATSLAPRTGIRRPRA